MSWPNKRLDATKPVRLESVVRGWRHERVHWSPSFVPGFDYDLRVRDDCVLYRRIKDNRFTFVQAQEHDNRYIVGEMLIHVVHIPLLTGSTEKNCTEQNGGGHVVSLSGVRPLELGDPSKAYLLVLTHSPANHVHVRCGALHYDTCFIGTPFSRGFFG